MGGITDLSNSMLGSIAGQEANQWSYAIGKATRYNTALEQDQLRQQQKLTNMQYAANSGLMKESYAQQKELWDETNAEAQIAHLKAAGLNPALMYAKGGVGGSTGGGGASVGSGQASDMTSRLQAQTQQQGMGLLMMKLQSEIDVNNSIAKKNLADAQTSEESRTYLVDKLRQEGHGEWLENIRNQYMMGETGNIVRKNALTGREAYISDASLFNAQITTEIAKTEAEKGNAEASALLTNEKAKGYFQELLNETLKADAAGIQAAAQKLSAEWNTGQFTNWKTWAELGKNAVQLILQGVK